MFRQGDYIVIKYDMGPSSDLFLTDHIYKQRADNSYLLSELDSVGNKGNGLSAVTFFDESTWRYATQSEIDLYDIYGSPKYINAIKPDRVTIASNDPAQASAIIYTLPRL